jgi:UDP-2,3-diacylglucosamine pyrophosphatase LpxH
MERDYDTLILSDLHLGSEISRASDALELLKSVTFWRLILLGDIFNDLNFRRLKKEHWEFLSHIRKLSNPKRCVEVVWVEGNHDLGLSDLMSHLVGIPVYQQYQWEYRDQRYLAIHGHQFDRFVSNNFFISRIGEILYLWIQKVDFGKKAISHYLDRLNTRWLQLSDKVAAGGLAYAAEHRSEYVFCGHTHDALKAESNGIRYYNSGSWIDGSKCSYITIGHNGVEIRAFDTRERFGLPQQSEPADFELQELSDEEEPAYAFSRSPRN